MSEEVPHKLICSQETAACIESIAALQPVQEPYVFNCVESWTPKLMGVPAPMLNVTMPSTYADVKEALSDLQTMWASDREALHDRLTGWVLRELIGAMSLTVYLKGGAVVHLSIGVRHWNISQSGCVPSNSIAHTREFKAFRRQMRYQKSVAKKRKLETEW